MSASNITYGTPPRFVNQTTVSAGTNITVTKTGFDYEVAATGGALSNPTPFTVTLTGTPLVTDASFYNASVDFASGDFVNLYIDVTGNSLQDLAVQLDLF
jgi:hypothetical protein